MKRAILILLLLSPAWAGLWQDGWHDADGDLWEFRREVNVTNPNLSGYTGEVVEFSTTFDGAFPYCDDTNSDSDLKDNSTDLLALRVIGESFSGDFNQTVFEVESYTCTSNRLESVSLEFRADLPASNEDWGWGDGTARYWLYYTNISRPFLSDEVNLPTQTATLYVKEGPENRRMDGTRMTWDGTPLRWRLCWRVTNSFDSWLFNTTTSESITFSGVKPYCDDTDTDGWIEAGEGGTLRIAEELGDGTIVELPLLVSSASCSDNNLTSARLTFIHGLPPSSQDIGFGSGTSRLWIYYDNHTSSFPYYPTFHNQTPYPFTRSFCPSEDGPGCPSTDIFFGPGACCSGYHYWDLDDSPNCESLCASLGYNASIQCCGDEPDEYFVGAEWTCMNSSVCYVPVDFDEDRAPFGDRDDTCGCNVTGSDDGKSCDSDADGDWDGFCVGEDCVACSYSLDFLCPNPNCMGIDPDCCDADHPCQAGLFCNATLKRCVAPVGQLCISDSDCLADSVCKTNICVARKFAYLQFGEMGVELGEQVRVPLLLRDPQGRTATYRMRLGGSGKYMAKFYGRSGEAEVTLHPGETKEIPLYVVGGKRGDYELEVVVFDPSSERGGSAQIIDSEVLEFHVRGGTREGIVVTAPEMAATDLLLLLLFSSVVFWKKRVF